MNIRYPLYEGVYRILTIDLFIAFNQSSHIASILSILQSWKIVLFQSCFPAFILSWNLEILQSRFLEILLSILLSCLKYGFQSWNLLQIKGEKTSVFRCVPICPALSHFVLQPTILQHYKSPLLCSGVTSRKGQRCKNGLVNVGLTVPRYPQSVRDGFRFSSENSKVCSMAHRTVFRAWKRLAPCGGKNHSEVVIF